MKLKGVESTVFGAKERRVSWSQAQISDGDENSHRNTEH